MIEPTHGQEHVSGPGSPLMIGLVATVAIILTFLLGFQLGRGDERTVIVTQTITSAPSASVAPTSRIQPALVDRDLQQAYYSNLVEGFWVICADDQALICSRARYSVIDGNTAFHPAAEHWPETQPLTIEPAPRLYVVGDMKGGKTWIADLGAAPAGSYQRLRGVTLNGSVEYFDLGALQSGRYLLMSESLNAFTRSGPLTFAAGLVIE